jgi:hypothetical protein
MHVCTQCTTHIHGMYDVACIQDVTKYKKLPKAVSQGSVSQVTNLWGIQGGSWLRNRHILGSNFSQSNFGLFQHVSAMFSIYRTLEVINDNIWSLFHAKM